MSADSLAPYAMDVRRTRGRRYAEPPILIALTTPATAIA